MPSRAPYLDDVLKPKNFLWANDLRLSTSPQCWLRIPMQTTADKIKIPSEPASHMASISSIVSSFDEYLIMCGATTEVFHSLWRFAASRKISLNCFYTPRNFFHSARHFFFCFYLQISALRNRLLSKNSDRWHFQPAEQDLADSHEKNLRFFNAIYNSLTKLMYSKFSATTS